jgi:hypothetical protein
MKKLLIIPILFFSCRKIDYDPKTVDVTKTCNNWQGIWWSVDGSFKDSLVISFDKMIGDTVYYRSNISYFDGYLKHKCPYKFTDDNLIIKKRNESYEFRYNH